MMNNADVIKGLYASFAEGDMPAILGAMDPLIDWTEAEGFMYGGKYTGPDSILENVFMKLGTEWEGFAAVPGHFVADENTVVALGTYTGKYLATGNSINVPFAHVWTLRDGRITRFQQYTDTLVIARDLGL